MNKIMKIFMVAALVVAMATPALAEFKFNGYFMAKGYSRQVKSTSDKDGDSQQFALQRFRGKLTYTLNENVAVVYYAEVDSDWGFPRNYLQENYSGYGLGGGGGIGGDGVNVETKNAYLDLKFGDTTAVIGLQGIHDQFFDGMIYNMDAAGVTANHKFGDLTLGVQYAKLDEGNDIQGSTTSLAYGLNGKSDWDDTDLYAVTVGNKFSDNFSAGFGVFFQDDNDFNNTDSATRDLYFFGPQAKVGFDAFTIDGWLLMQSGEVEFDNPATSDYDVEGFVGTVKGTFKLANGDVGLRFLYGSEDDDDKDDGAWRGDFDQYAFPNENQMIFLVDKYTTNDGKEQYALNDSLKAGYGLMAFIASGNHKLADDMYVKWGAGYYLAADDEKDDNPATKREGDTLGYEVAARVGKKFFEKVDVSLNAAYAGFGDFYDNTVNGTDDPDDIYKAYLMVFVPF